ncbi:MAG: MotA/TolQ/ExbB proton channel family protein [Candidatus Methylacidiphilales bacterium]|nr:MotA/TolQ/ExbB proton channel family protein [Candidatus Methylacidiphilales bacterium]
MISDILASAAATSGNNIVVDTFIKGGPIMWPILITSLVAVGVVVERVVWWSGQSLSRDHKKLDAVYEAIEQGDVPAASSLAGSSRDPVLRSIYHGLNHHHASLEGAFQVAAGTEIERAGKGLAILDTIVTLAPLLGLLGTVTGIMHSFHFVGDEQLAATKVSGGIAEALIATAAGLTIAILCLLPYNYFTARVAKLQFELQTAGTNLELLFKAAESRLLKNAETLRSKNNSGSSASKSASHNNKEHANETAFAAAA